MNLDFKLWSLTNPKAIQNIDPHLGMREWNDLTKEEKILIWRYFSNGNWFDISFEVFLTVFRLNHKYKKQSYGRTLLEHGGPHWNIRDGACCKSNALTDFRLIFMTENQDVVFELLSIFVLSNLNESALKNLDEAMDEVEKKEIINKAYERVDEFVSLFNDIFEQFSINVMLTRRGIILRQEDAIINAIYTPVLSFLSDPKWQAINRDLEDAFAKFQ